MDQNISFKTLCKGIRQWLMGFIKYVSEIHTVDTNLNVEGLFTRNVFFSPSPLLPSVLNMFFYRHQNNRERMSLSAILTVIHTTTIGTMLNFVVTRMHSSRMRTARSLTVSHCIRKNWKNHAPPRKTTHAPPEKPCTPPLEKPRMPPNKTMHAPWIKPCMPPK